MLAGLKYVWRLEPNSVFMLMQQLPLTQELFFPHIISASLLSRTTGKSDTTSGAGNDKTNLLLCMCGENYSIACIFFIFQSKHLQDKIEALHKEHFGHNAKIQNILD